MVPLANNRLREARRKYPKARVTGLDDLRVFYLLADEPEKYHQYASTDLVPGVMDRKMALKKIGRSLKDLSREWNLLHKMVS
jgi:formate dehydrogenase iron-sulfur subunit